VRRSHLVAAGLGLVTAIVAAACAPDSGTLPEGTTGTGGSGGIDFDAGIPDEDALPNPDAACGLITEQGEATPVNLYILLDKSSSMVGTKWDSAKAGLAAFLEDPESAGLRVAIRFFPRDADATPACDQPAYATPTVGFAPLPGNAAAIVAAMEAETPDGFSTPIYPALGGGILGGIAVAEANPGERSVVLLVTDGQPQGPADLCGGVDPEDPAAIAALAATGASYDPSVLTYVVGLPGADQDLADQIAVAGGTEAAILVGVNDVAAGFEAALAAVRGKAVPCEYQIPAEVAGGEVNPFLVNLLLTASGATDPVLVPYDPGCAAAGWHYDDPAAPTKILLCPQTCGAVRDDLGSKLEVLLGCKTAEVE
jgi:hypothetical protein